MKTIISLCDITGNMVQPWIEAGYRAFLVDPQHGTTRTEGTVTKFAGTVEDAMADHYFHPSDYTWYEPTDHYTKKTALWTGGGFIMPTPRRAYSKLWSAPDDRIHKAAPGPERENFRSATPMGFARAVFDANHHRLQAVA